MQQVAEIIAREIAREGPMPFARFMELALYCPVYGYYETEGDRIGRRGDYYTSVSTGSLFGQLLACQFCEWLVECELAGPASAVVNDCHTSTTRCHEEGQRGTIHLVEAGAHDGNLARDILSWIREQRPEIFARIRYCLVEPSERRQRTQQSTLRDFAGQVFWLKTMDEFARIPGLGVPDPQGRPVRGIIFSNELLDSMPVHRFGWDAGQQRWFEWGVALENGRFVWTALQSVSKHNHPMPQSRHLAPKVQASGTNLPALEQLFAFSSQVPDLPGGFTIEFCPAALEWWRQAANTLARGKLLTIDYGLSDDELFKPERQQGTLRAYHRHLLTPDPLANPGGQDLTAHVNFSAVQQTGEAAGLQTDSLLTQEQFLTQIAGRIWQGAASFGEWTPLCTRQFQTLTHPEHLGRAFRVLVQSRG